jgi:hypothetical protein
MDERSPTTWARFRGVRVGAVLAIALAAGFVAWLVLRDDDGSPSASSTTVASTGGPVAATPGALRSLSAEVGHPLYWIGNEPNTTYELTRTSGGRVFIRYLPPGVPIGVRQARYTIVGTYPVANALGVLRRLSKRHGEKRLLVPRGGLAVYSTSTPTNVYVAYPDSNLQIELFDPSPERARQLVTSGRVGPVG